MNYFTMTRKKKRLTMAKGIYKLKKKNVVADLHLHSTASDGLLSPEQLVTKACEKGLEAIALTDHDTVSGIKAARQAAVDNSIRLIPGIELSCGWEGVDSSLHVLGLFVNEDADSLTKLLETQRVSRFHRALKMVDLLASLDLNVEELKQRFLANDEKVLGRPHIARFLVEKGYVKEFQEAFDRYLSRGRPAYVPKEQVDPGVGIDIIHAAGGIAIIAHPGLVPDWDKVWEKIHVLSWDGIETHYSEHKNSQVAMFKTLVDRKGWLSSGGSDYHGDYGKHVDRLGKFGLSADEYELFLKKCAERGIVIGN